MPAQLQPWMCIIIFPIPNGDVCIKTDKLVKKTQNINNWKNHSFTFSYTRESLSASGPFAFYPSTCLTGRANMRFFLLLLLLLLWLVLLLSFCLYFVFFFFVFIFFQLCFCFLIHFSLFSLSFFLLVDGS